MRRWPFWEKWEYFIFFIARTDTNINSLLFLVWWPSNWDLCENKITWCYVLSSAHIGHIIIDTLVCKRKSSNICELWSRPSMRHSTNAASDDKQKVKLNAFRGHATQTINFWCASSFMPPVSWVENIFSEIYSIFLLIRTSGCPASSLPNAHMACGNIYFICDAK